MSTLRATAGFTISDYLNRERDSLEKHEYRDGEILAMSGGSARHSLISANVIRELGNRLKGKPCRVYDSNLRIRIPRSVLYTYPDASVVCDAPQVDPDDPLKETVINPTVVVEILSPSTEAYDRGEICSGFAVDAADRAVPAARRRRLAVHRVLGGGGDSGSGQPPNHAGVVGSLRRC